MHRVWAIGLAAMLECMTAAQSANAAGASAYLTALQRSQNTQQLIDACRYLVPTLFSKILIIAAPQKTAEGDAAFAGLRKFILTGRNAPARIRCGRYLTGVSLGPYYEPNTLTKTVSPYSEAATSVLIAMLDDRDPVIRAGAADDLWGIPSAAAGRALLRHAATDASPTVAAASFRNMFWAMRADIAASQNQQAYDTAITRALTSAHEEVIAGALTAFAGLHRLDADSTLRKYAIDKRAAVRLGAITAYDSMMAYNPSIESFLETRLRDPDIDVRDRVMLELMRMGDINALPAIDKLARTAATSKERAAAAAYAKTIRKDADANGLSHP